MSMPELSDYLSSLHERGVRLWIDGGQLRYQASKGTLSTADLARLRMMRANIVSELTKPPLAAADHTMPVSQGEPQSIPVSFQQRWLLSLMEQDDDWPQTQSFAFRLTGLLQAQLLKRSVDALLRAHDSLRARVVSADGHHCWKIDEPCKHPLDVVAVPESLAVEEKHNIRTLIADLTARRAERAADSMLYTRLVRISDQQHYLILVVHRLAADCLAIGQIFRELWLQYGEGLRSQSPQSTPQSKQYRDYTLWQRATDAPWQQKHAGYWQQHLCDAVPIQWPADGSASRGAENLVLLQGALGGKLSARLRELGRRAQSLPSMVMLTLYVCVISRWCKQQDFVVPFNVAGRHAAHDGVVGCFSHVLFLRVRLKGGELFQELLRRVSDEFYKAVFHQDFGRVALNRPDLLGGTFCQWLSWHPAELAGQEMYDIPQKLGISAQPVHFQSAWDFTNVPPGVTDLEVCFFDSATDIRMLLIFRRERFAESTLERLIQELRTLAEQIVTDPLWCLSG